MTEPPRAVRIDHRRRVAAPSDASLLAAHLRGDRAAFGVLVGRHRVRLCREALRILGHREDAEDAVQESLARAMTYADSYRGDAPVERWLHRIVVNVALTAVHRRARRETGEPAAARRREDDPTTTDPMGRVDDAAVVHRALRDLPEDLRRTYLLAVLHGHSTEEVAAMTGVPAGTVKSRLWRARGALSAVLDAAFWSEDH